jgi:hypothetical protein
MVTVLSSTRARRLPAQATLLVLTFQLPRLPMRLDAHASATRGLAVLSVLKSTRVLEERQCAVERMRSASTCPLRQGTVQRVGSVGASRATCSTHRVSGWVDVCAVGGRVGSLVSEWLVGWLGGCCG